MRKINRAVKVIRYVNKTYFSNNLIKYLFSILFIILLCLYLTHNAIYNVINFNRNLFIESKKNIISQYDNKLPSGFYYLDRNNKNGPITLNRQIDDGTKTDFYKYFSEYNPEYLKEDNNRSNKTQISIVMFADKLNPNSIYENAVSEAYQYANIHNYTLSFNHLNYNKEKEIYYMKFSAILEKIIEGMKENNCDWIFWLDGDVSITNPTIKLETFLPEDENINFVAATDYNGLNAGVFFLKVNSWSYNIIINAMSYPHFKEKEYLRFAEQTALNNVLSKEENTKHYYVVPLDWFNRFYGGRVKGDFIVHFPGHKHKDQKAQNLRKEVGEKWYKANNNESLRKKVLNYYSLPRNKQENEGILTFKKY